MNIKKENMILWVSSFVITFLVLYITNLFSPDYPITGTIGINGQKVSYRFEKNHFGKEDVKIIIRTDIKDLAGNVYWKNDNDSIWSSHKLTNSDLVLSSDFHALKPGKKLKYYVEVSYNNKNYFLPDNQKVEMRFFGKIPSTINYLRFLLLNIGLLLVVRVGLEYFNQEEKIKKFEIFIAIIFLILTVLVNPLFLSYKYGFINSSIPSITKLFPTKELSLTSLWIISIILTFNIKKYRIIPFISAILTIFIFIILK